jgi:hypothetical protein
MLAGIIASVLPYALKILVEQIFTSLFGFLQQQVDDWRKEESGRLKSEAAHADEGRRVQEEIGRVNAPTDDDLFKRLEGGTI